MSDDAMLRQLMAAALVEAKQAAARGEVPVGAVVVHEHRIIARAGNEIEARQDATAHAELLALQRASQVLNRRRLTGCRMVVTLEPCSMCAMAMVLTRIEALAFGARDPKFGGIVSVVKLLDEGRFNHRVAWSEGYCADECAAVLQEFFQGLREQRREREQLNSSGEVPKRL